MKKITLEKVERALASMSPEVIVGQELAGRANTALAKMLDILDSSEEEVMIILL